MKSDNYIRQNMEKSNTVVNQSKVKPVLCTELGGGEPTPPFLTKKREFPTKIPHNGIVKLPIFNLILPC